MVLMFGVCLGASPSSGEAASPLTVILISMDGTRPADIRPDTLPTLVDLARRGASATHLAPVFPTNTFPNHVTLVTGVAPAMHGIVSNVFLDPGRGLFRYSNDPTWIEVEPIWSIAERHGVVSAAFHWIGSEGPWRNGHGPRHWRAFDRSTKEREKVDQILAWIDTDDESDRPRLITSWFRGADAAAHREGPDSDAARASLRVQDRALARLVAGLDSRGAFATTILLVVSDHGMLPVADVVDLDAALREAGIRARVLGGGGFAIVNSYDGGHTIDDILITAKALGLSAFRRGATPAGISASNPRFGEVVVLAPVGTAISGRSGPPMRGSHGYLPAEPGMGALFVAAGGGIRPGQQLGEAKTLDVAPTLLGWLGIPVPDWMEGRPIEGLTVEASAPRPPGETEEAK